MFYSLKWSLCFDVYSSEASEADKAVFAALPEGPAAATYPHLARWYKHIAAVQGLTAK
jgi:elongation factor 1-beta